MLWNAGLPKFVPVHDIAIQVRENEIVLGTHGRSIYVAKLDEVQKGSRVVEKVDLIQDKKSLIGRVTQFGLSVGLAPLPSATTVINFKQLKKETWRLIKKTF